MNQEEGNFYEMVKKQPRPIDRIGTLAGQGVKEMYGQAAGSAESAVHTLEEKLSGINEEIEQSIIRTREQQDELQKWVEDTVKPMFIEHARFLREEGAKMADLIQRGAALADHAAKSHAAINAQIANGDTHEEKPQNPADGPVDLDLLAGQLLSPGS